MTRIRFLHALCYFSFLQHSIQLFQGLLFCLFFFCKLPTSYGCTRTEIKLKKWIIKCGYNHNAEHGKRAVIFGVDLDESLTFFDISFSSLRFTCNSLEYWYNNFNTPPPIRLILILLCFNVGDVFDISWSN